MSRRRIRIGQTVATILAEPEWIPVAERDVRLRRGELLAYIRAFPEFATSLRPLSVSADAPGIVRGMADAAARVGVGPMAAVAGAIAASAVRAMREAGADHAVFDNGGDIALDPGRPVVVGIHALFPAFRNLGFRFEPGDGPIAVCTSSAVFGHSLSFGKAEAAVVVARDAALADAAATALGNLVTGTDSESLERALDALPGEGIEGMLVIAGGLLGMRGRCPEIRRVEPNEDLITRG